MIRYEYAAGCRLRRCRSRHRRSVAIELQPRVGFAYRSDDKTVLRGGYAMSSWTGRFGFTGGTLSTQFPVIYNVQNGSTRTTSIVDGTFTSLPPIPLRYRFLRTDESTRRRIRAFFVIPSHNPLPTMQNYNLTLQRQLAGG